MGKLPGVAFKKSASQRGKKFQITSHILHKYYLTFHKIPVAILHFWILLISVKRLKIKGLLWCCLRPQSFCAFCSCEKTRMFAKSFNNCSADDFRWPYNRTFGVASQKCPILASFQIHFLRPF